MEQMFKSLFAMLHMAFLTVINSTRAINHLSLAASQRTAIIQEKSGQAAALSQLEGRYAFAQRLHEIQSSDVDPKVLKAADTYIANWNANHNVM